MKEDDYRVFPLPVFIVSSKNGRILYSNPLAQKSGFDPGSNFYEMIEEKAVFGMFVQKGAHPLHIKTTVVIEGKAFSAKIDAALTEHHGGAVFLIVVTDMKEASLIHEDAMIAKAVGAYTVGDKNPVLEFLRITARGTGAFCASLYEKKNGRYTLCDEWRAKKSISVPMLSADVENAADQEMARLKSLKHAADGILVPYRKSQGTEGIAVCFFESAADERLRTRIERMIGVYTLLAPDSQDNNMTALIQGIEGIEQGVAVWEADTKDLLYENKAFREKFGSGSAKLLLSRLKEGESPSAGQRIHKDESTGKSYGITHTKTRHGRRTLMTTVVFDITRYKQAENKLEMLAKTDMLTGLNNRRAGLEILEAAYLSCRKQHRPITVCFADIDGLKRVNDTYGHGVGDNMIRAVAMILKKQLDGTGEVCRLGGDEFLLILPGIQKTQAMLLASRIKQAVSRTFVSEAQSISMSFGFKEAEFDPNETVYTLINVADSDMYREKRSKA